MSMPGGVTLAGYFIDETTAQRKEREERLAGRKGNGNGVVELVTTTLPCAPEPALEPEPESEVPGEDIQIKAFQKLMERFANNQTVSGKDMFEIMQEVTSDAG